VLDGGDGGVTVAGTLDASSAKALGGTIQVTGGAVTLAATAVADASGATGGGTVQIGGGPHGGGTLRHAKTTSVQAGAQIRADATVQGNGGTVTLWSDQATRFDGSISARGAGTGNGGWVETSSQGALGVGGTAMVDTRAPGGKVGSWLLDPYDIVVQSGGAAYDPDADGNIEDQESMLTIDPAGINNASSSVTLYASHNLTVSSPITMTNATAGLTLIGENQVEIDAPVSLNGAFAAQVGMGGTFNLASTGSITTPGTVSVFQDGSNPQGLEGTGTGAAITIGGAITANGIYLKAADPQYVQAGSITIGADVMTSGAGTFQASIGSGGSFTENAGVTITAAGAVVIGEASSFSTGTINIYGTVSGAGVDIEASGVNSGAAGYINIGSTASISNTETAASNSAGSADLVFYSGPGTGGWISLTEGASITANAGNIAFITDRFILNTPSSISTVSTPGTVIYSPATTLGSFTGPNLHLNNTTDNTPEGFGTSVDIGSGASLLPQNVVAFLSGGNDTVGGNGGTLGSLQIGLPGSTNTTSIVGTTSLPIATTIYGGTTSVNGAVTGGSSLTLSSTGSILVDADITTIGLFQAGVGGGQAFTQMSGTTISGGTGVIVYDNATSAGATISIGGAITAPEIYLLASDHQSSQSGQITLQGTGTLVNNNDNGSNDGSNLATTILYAGPGGGITLDAGMTINGGRTNIALISDTLTVNTSSAVSTVSTFGRVIVSPASTNGELRVDGTVALPNSFTNAPNYLLDFAAPAGVGTLSDIGVVGGSGTYNLSQTALTTLGGTLTTYQNSPIMSVARLQIGLPGATNTENFAGPISLPTETSNFAGTITVASTAAITIASNSLQTFDTDGGVPGVASGLFFTLVQTSASTGSALSIAPGASITVPGNIQLSSACYSAACTVTPTASIGGSLTAGEAFFYTGSGADQVTILPGTVISSTGAPDVGGISITAASLALAGALRTNGGEIDLNAPVTLIGTTVIDTSINNGALTLGSVDGAFGLTINAGTGAVTAGPIGAGTALASLTIGAGSISLGSVTTTGAQSYTGTVSLNGVYSGGSFSTSGAAVLAGATTIGATGGNIAFGGAIDGAQSLTLADTNGTVAVSGPIGGKTALSSLTLGGNGSAINFAGGVTTVQLTDTRTAGSLTITGSLATPSYVAAPTNSVLISIGGFGANPLSLSGQFNFVNALNLGREAVTLAGATVLDTSTNNAALTLGGVDGGFGLTLNAGTGTVVLNGAAGAQAALASLTINGGTISLGSVATTGAQTYTGTTSFNGSYTGSGFTANGADLLGGATGVTVSGAGNIGFGGTLDGGQSLVLTDANGRVSFGGAVGGTTALGSLTVTANGIVAGSVATTGAQRYSGVLTAGGIYSANGFTTAGPMVMLADTTINGGTGDITLGAVNGLFNLVLTSADANVFFNGTVGAAAARLPLLSIAGADNVTVGVDPATGNTFSLFVDNFTASHVAGLISVGNHSLESDDSVNISAGSLEGHATAADLTIVTTGGVSGNFVATGVSTITTGGDFSGSLQTRSGSITSGGDIAASVTSTNDISLTATNVSGTVVSGGLAQIAASQNVSADVTGGSVAIQAGGSITGSATGGHVNLTAPVVNETIDAQSATITSPNQTLTGSIGGVDAGSLGAGNVTQEVLGATQQVASNAVADDSAAATDDETTDDEPAADGETTDGKKKKAKTKGAVYDFANQYIDNLISGKPTH